MQLDGRPHLLSAPTFLLVYDNHKCNVMLTAALLGVSFRRFGIRKVTLRRLAYSAVLPVNGNR